jgi:hypothetical protein
LGEPAAEYPFNSATKGVVSAAIDVKQGPYGGYGKSGLKNQYVDVPIYRV